MEILKQHEEASGQQINREKTQLFFSPNTDPYTQEEIKSLLGVTTITNYENISVYPLLLGEEKNKASVTLGSGFGTRCKGERKITIARWQGSVDKSGPGMPTYTMGCFKLPKSLCKDIESLIRKIWWGYKGEAQKIHWVGWKKLCKSKC